MIAEVIALFKIVVSAASPNSTIKHRAKGVLAQVEENEVLQATRVDRRIRATPT